MNNLILALKHFNPWNRFVSFVPCSIRLRAHQSWQRRGDSESPCLWPLELVKAPLGVTLIMLVEATKPTHSLIQQCPNAKPHSSYQVKEKSKLTFSLPMSKSSLLMRPGFLCLLWLKTFVCNKHPIWDLTPMNNGFFSTSNHFWMDPLPYCHEHLVRISYKLPMSLKGRKPLILLLPSFSCMSTMNDASTYIKRRSLAWSFFKKAKTSSLTF